MVPSTSCEGVSAEIRQVIVKESDVVIVLLNKIENYIASSNWARASSLSYCALLWSCEKTSHTTRRLVNELIYGPLSLSVEPVLEFLSLLNREGLPDKCIESLAGIPLGIIYNLPVGDILDNETLNSSLLEFIDNLLDLVLNSNTQKEVLEEVYREVNTFFSEYSKILGGKGLSSKFKKQFERIEDKWIRLVNLLSLSTDY
ncbi:MAG: hypothetical protein QXR24_05725 [Thermosphaera sp.]